MGHTLDVVMTFDNNPAISKVKVNEYDISHHYLIDFTMKCAAERHESKTITFRNLKAVDLEKFDADWKEAWDGIRTGETFGETMLRYKEVGEKIVSEHAPLVTKTIKIVPDAP